MAHSPTTSDAATSTGSRPQSGDTEHWRRLLLQRLASLRASGIEQLRRVPWQGPVVFAAEGDAPPALSASVTEPSTSAPVPSGSALAATLPAPRLAEEAERGRDAGAASGLAPASPLSGEDRTSGALPRTLLPAADLASADLAPAVSGTSGAADRGAWPPESLARDPSLRLAALAILQGEVVNCKLCSELARTRRQTVFGVGQAQPRVVFIGEAPGADEDAQGEPFVGAAGQLLNKILAASGFRREDVYIMNVLKCRPPGNRTPTSVEAGHCRPFFERQLEILAPEFIVCLGTVAATNLLQKDTTVGRLRGKVHAYRGAQVIVTYHPSYLLRTPAAKAQTWEDMKLLLRTMGLPVPKS